MRSRSLTARAIITVAVATSVAASALTATAPALGQAPAASPDVPAAPSTEVAAPVPSPSSSASPATSAESGDGLILFTVYDGAGAAGPSPCSTFHTIRPDGSGEQQLTPVVGCATPTPGTAVFGSASWSPAGDGILIDSESGGDYTPTTTQISEVATDGGTPHVLLTVTGVTPTFSPDGSQIAYVDGSGGIVIAAADGTHPRQLTSTPDPTKSSDSYPSFSPDGSRLAFTRSTGDPSGSQIGTSELWIVNADGTDLHRLTTGLQWLYPARWSPDGSRLLFSDAQAGLWVIDADGTGLTRVSIPCEGVSPSPAVPPYVSPSQPCRPATVEFAFDWSPDGSRIVFHQFGGRPNNSLRVMNADGSGSARTLVSGSGQPSLFGWLDWGLPNTPKPEAP